MTRRRGLRAAAARRSRGALVLSALATGLGAAGAAEGAAAPIRPVSEAVAMVGTADYCTGYERTFHGSWRPEEVLSPGPPVLFRIGLNAGGAGCYAQLNMKTPPGVAPYELPRFRARAREDAGWTLRYRAIVLEIDPESGRVVRREGGSVVRSGVLLPRPPPVCEALPAPSAERRARWYGTWRGRFPGAPFPVTLQLTESLAGNVMGRISMLLMKQDFSGWYHGEMLIFRWKNRHVGLVLEPDGDTLVYNDYRGRLFRFRRRG